MEDKARIQSVVGKLVQEAYWAYQATSVPADRLIHRLNLRTAHARDAGSTLESQEKVRPQYPLTVRFNDGEVETIADDRDACCNLEWLDTDDAEDPVVVSDALGRRVRMRMAFCEIAVCEIAVCEIDICEMEPQIESAG